MYRVYIDKSIPQSSPFYLRPFLHIYKFHILMFCMYADNPMSLIRASLCTRCKTICRNIVSTSDYVTKENWLLPTATLTVQLGVWPSSLPTQVLITLILPKPCASSHSCCWFVVIASLSYLEDIVLQKFSLASGSYKISAPSSAMFPELLGDGDNIDVLFRAEHPTVPYFLLSDKFWGFHSALQFRYMFLHST